MESDRVVPLPEHFSTDLQLMLPELRAFQETTTCRSCGISLLVYDRLTIEVKHLQKEFIKPLASVFDIKNNHSKIVSAETMEKQMPDDLDAASDTDKVFTASNNKDFQTKKCKRKKYFRSVKVEHIVDSIASTVALDAEMHIDDEGQADEETIENVYDNFIPELVQMKQPTPTFVKKKQIKREPQPIAKRPKKPKLDLLSHLTNVGIERPFSCPLCDKKFKQSHHLVEHLRSHTGAKPYKCDQCEMRFTHKHSLNMHVIRQHPTNEDGKKFLCVTCDKHYPYHEKFGPQHFHCDLCDKHFTHKGSLTTHKRIHTGDKPFACSYCNKRFLRNSHLKSHLEKMHLDQLIAIKTQVELLQQATS